MNLNWLAKGTMSAFKGGMGKTIQGAAWGAAAGAGWGMMSGNTSVLGGALMGAGLGAGGMRYGASGVRRARFGMRGIGVSNPGMRGRMTGFGKGVLNRMRMDYRGAQMWTNKAPNRFRGIFK